MKQLWEFCVVIGIRKEHTCDTIKRETPTEKRRKLSTCKITNIFSILRNSDKLFGNQRYSENLKSSFEVTDSGVGKTGHRCIYHAVMTCFSCLFGRWDGSSTKRSTEFDEELSSVHNLNLFTYKELRIATDDFCPTNKVGEGGFGSVYKGRLKNGKIAAIKVLSAQSKQGVREFMTEIKVIADIEHENLVKLYGCCAEGDHRILVYNYLENNSLAQTLLGGGHSEYAIRGQLTRKSDVYSFGVLLVEIVTGRCNMNSRLPIAEQFLLGRTWELYERRELVGLVDTSLNGEFDAEVACRFLKIGLLCTQDAPNLRPFMSAVVKMLTGEIDIEGKEITKPALISEFIDLRDKTTPKAKPYKTSSSCIDTSSFGNLKNSLSSSEMMSVPTTTFPAIYDQSI
ncbi:hypothetical protein RHSIM_Rhsim06G0236100 [Rhododendron simsii]|uniref:Protein kinase domain-containing protein n=1 Tax=Rhododendron simsii TaxID=118357 RepID=A0A834LLB9_RHOSS|nr:hypothetical protein RHSIM_Rhsim06G0236100 [Rhododendron simsii]